MNVRLCLIELFSLQLFEKEIGLIVDWRVYARADVVSSLLPFETQAVVMWCRNQPLRPLILSFDDY